MGTTARLWHLSCYPGRTKKQASRTRDFAGISEMSAWLGRAGRRAARMHRTKMSWKIKWRNRVNRPWAGEADQEEFEDHAGVGGCPP